MVRRATFVFFGAAALSILLTPPVALAAVIMNADNGASERIVDSDGRLKKDMVGVIWFPALNPNTTVYGVTGSCKRFRTGTGESVGSNKVKFTQVFLEDFVTGLVVELPNFKSTMKNGLPNKVQVVDITSEVRPVIGTDSLILGAATVKVTKDVDAGDYVQCFYGVVEGDASLIPASASTEERQVALEEVARNTIYREFRPEFE